MMFEPDQVIPDKILHGACIEGELSGKTFREVWATFPMRCPPYYIPPDSQEYCCSSYHGPFPDDRVKSTLVNHGIYNKGGIKRPLKTILRALWRRYSGAGMEDYWWNR